MKPANELQSIQSGAMQAYEDQTRELRVAVKAAHREGEYQASMAMRSMQERMTLALQRSDAATAQLAECAPLDVQAPSDWRVWSVGQSHVAEATVC